MYLFYWLSLLQIEFVDAITQGTYMYMYGEKHHKNIKGRPTMYINCPFVLIARLMICIKYFEQ